MKPKKWELAVLVLLVLGLALWALLPRRDGKTVTVSVDGEQAGSYALDRDLELLIHGYNGFSLTLVIAGGQAHVEDATCPDLICQHHAPVSGSGEQIVCLPARVVVTVSGEEAGIDAVTE